MKWMDVTFSVGLLLLSAAERERRAAQARANLKPWKTVADAARGGNPEKSWPIAAVPTQSLGL